tara:strand:+ start:1104 stop:2066 length:963 start_codon:yes stop_codon:yes gene_type:complete
MKKIINYIYITISLIIFKITNRSLNKTNVALISLYSIDNGYSLNLFHSLLKIKKKNTKKPTSLIYKKNQLVSNDELKENGYCKFSEILNSDNINELIKTAKKLKSFDGNSFVYFDEKKLNNTRYNFDKNELINQSSIQKLIMDEAIIDIARQYFESEPIFDMPAMWWSTPFGDGPSSEAAQLYHFDLDRVKWLKIFFYLTDVNDFNGPHFYIEKTHKINSKPKELLSRGYVRISDDEMKNYFDDNNFKVIKGSKGLAFAADTLCWHKGKNLTKGSRLVLELNYTSSLFGINTSKLKLNKENNSFTKFCSEHPIYSKNIKI